MYGCYLIGQTAGMSSALSITATVEVMELCEVPRAARAELASILIVIHQCWSEVMESRKPKHG